MRSLKDATFYWTHDQENAFSTLKSMLPNAPILQHPDFSKKFILTTNVLNYALGAILSQPFLFNRLILFYSLSLPNLE